MTWLGQGRARPEKIVLAIAIAAAVMFIIAQVAGNLQARKARDHRLGTSYQGIIASFRKLSQGGRYSRKTTGRVAVIRGLEGRELIILDPAQQFADCDVGDTLSYQVTESAVTGTAFTYRPGSCGAS